MPEISTPKIEVDPHWYSFEEADGNSQLVTDCEFENPDRKQFYGSEYPAKYNKFLDIQYTNEGHSIHHTLMQKWGSSNTHYVVFDSEEGTGGNLYVLLAWMKTVYMIGRLNPECPFTKQTKNALLKKKPNRQKRS